MNFNGDVVKSARLKLGWTQEQLAAIADLSVRTVQRAEREGVASLETINSICVSLRLKLDELQPDVAIETEEDVASKWIVLATFIFGSILGFVLNIFL